MDLSMVRRATALVLPVVTLFALIAAWYVLVRVYDVPPQVVPSPETVGSELARLPEYLAKQSWYTFREVWYGFGIAVAVGVTLALAISSSHVVDQAISPILIGFNAIPKIAIGPMLVMWFGFGMEPKIFVVVLLCFFPIVLSTATGLTTTPADLAELGRSLNASWWQSFRKVRFPAALPQIFVGLKVAMPLAAIGAVIGEFYSDRPGLGYQILQYNGVGDTATAWAAIVLVALMSIVLYAALSLVERLALPWVRATTSAR